MQSDRTIQAGQHSYTIRFGQNALYLLEEHLTKLKNAGTLQPRKFKHADPKTGASVEMDLPIGVEDLSQLPRRLGTQIGLWAGLEGARRKYKTRSEPFTIDEAGEIIDEAGGFQAVEATVVESFAAAFPQYFPKPEEAVVEEAPKNDQEEPAPTGTRSSKPRSKPASPLTTSGT